MDRTELKTLLEAYRPGTVDAQDPIFCEALAAVQTDPELAAWFAESQRFDALLVEKFQEMLPVSDEVKFQALRQGRGPARPSRLIHWPVPLALAALLMIGLGTWFWAHPRMSPGQELGLQAINYSTDMPALQFVCFDASVVASWVQKQPFVQKAGIRLNKPPGNMKMIGSSMTHWGDRPVAMICLQDGERMAMLYLLEGNDFPMEKGLEMIQKAGWTSETGKIGRNTYVLTARGTPQDLRYDLPF